VAAKALKLVFAPLAAYFAGFVALTWPLVQRFSTHRFADAGDGLQHIWNHWWVKTALLERHTSFWFTDVLWHPTGVSLFAHTITWVNGLLALAFSAFLSDVQTYNAIVCFAFVVTGWTTFLLAHHVSRSWWGSLFAGAAMTFSSYHFAHAEGHQDLISLEWVPLFLLLWIRLLERPGFLRALAAAACLLAVTGTSPYYSLYCVLAGAILFPVWVIRHPDAWRAAGWRGPAALLAFAALALGTSGLYFWKLHQLTIAEPTGDSHPPLEWCLDLGSPFIPGGHWRFAELTRGFWQLLPGNVHETSVSMGWSLIGAAAFTLWALLAGRVRGAGAWAAIAAVFFALALGPALKIFGRQYDYPWLPYGFVERALPSFRLSGMPIRMMSMVQLATAVFAAAGFAELLRTALRPAVARIAFVALFVLETLPAPIPTTPPGVPDYVKVLATLPDGAVFGLDEIDLSSALYHQTIIGKPINGGYISRRPRSVMERYAQMKQALVQGRIDDFFAASRARYVVWPNLGLLERPPPGLKTVFVGERYSIFAAASDPVVAKDAPVPR
jgi:hypothetical protein